ncbi:MAG TPA: acyltransferase [Acidimicrobiia bacterium]|jgi:acetyltransferase-like isoleucine patch superfamily enzyme
MTASSSSVHPIDVIGFLRRAAGAFVRAAWERAGRWAAIGEHGARSRGFRSFGKGSAICFPVAALYGERYITVGEGTVLGPYVTLSAGVSPEHDLGDVEVVSIGDRCLIGRGSGIVAHERVVIGDDVFTGHHVYITDANHGYEDLDVPPSRQFAASRPVSIGAASWLGHGTIVLPGVTIGRHVVVGAGSVVTGDLPDRCVAVGNPARVIRRYVEGQGWVDVGEGPADAGEG